MSDRSKKIFLALSIIVPFMLYCVFYYSNMIKNAPFRFTDFESLELTYGFPDSMLNYYNSKTHQYNYLTKEGQLVKDTLTLKKDELLYLHRKAQEFGFWNVDNDMITPEEGRKQGQRVARYKLTFTYKEKSKTVTMDADYPGNPKMVEAARTTVDEVLRMLASAKAK
ncbi:hypothetical protein [Sphingobacterium sp. CZ-2]|uniref:hypothetical protein n=1 Tax=Sphingobacterium sp. CZ-2 TaxID=2557994 RepID=UPI001FD63E3C|nr:hypothetical protein [Sphingobacterium sp. CZ-2]